MERLDCLIVTPQTCEGVSPVELRSGIVRVKGNRLVVRLQFLVITAEVVEDIPAVDPPLRISGVDCKGAVRCGEGCGVLPVPVERIRFSVPGPS